jgi:hypothetical protein
VTFCPKCGAPLEFVLVQDGSDDTPEVMDVYCSDPDCDFDLGDAVVEP